MDRHIFSLCMAMLAGYHLMANKFIAGKVVDGNGQAVLFAAVHLPGGRGTVCDSHGMFSICADSVSFPLKFTVSAIDYHTKEVYINNEVAEIRVTLTPKIYQLEDIYVVKETGIKNKSAVSALTVNEKEIEEQMPLHIGEVLQNKSGFTQKSGFQAPLVLRGLSGKRMLVLRNGNRRFSSYPAGFMSHIINVFDLKRIEVEKGAASVSYGAGAIAGIINLIDRSPFEKQGFSGKLTSGFSTNNEEKSILLSGGWSNGILAVKSNLRLRSADDFYYADGTKAENSAYKDKDLFFSTGYRPTENQALLISLNLHQGGPWGKTIGFNGTQYLRAKTNEENSNNYELSYSICNSGLLSKFNVSCFYSSENRKLEKSYFTAAGNRRSFQETTFYSDYYYGVKVIGDWNELVKWEFRSGAEFYSYHLSSPVESVDYIQGIAFNNRVSVNARSAVWGMFYETNYHLSDRIKFSGGVRYDLNTISEGEVFDLDLDKERKTRVNAFSGSLAVRMKIAEHSTLKVNVARSFRMPQTAELFTENYTSRGILYGNPNLNPEYCYNLDAGINVNGKYLHFEASPFLWLMDDMINLEEIKGQPGTNFQYINLGRTRLWGGEVVVKFPFHQVIMPHDKLDFAIGVAYVNGTNVTERHGYLKPGEPLDFIPSFNVKSELRFHTNPSKAFYGTMIFNATHYTKQKRLPEGGYATPAYFLVDSSVGIVANCFKTQPSLRMAINNLFNADYYTFQSYLPAAGRNIRLFLTFNLN